MGSGCAARVQPKQFYIARGSTAHVAFSDSGKYFGASVLVLDLKIPVEAVPAGVSFRPFLLFNSCIATMNPNPAGKKTTDADKPTEHPDRDQLVAFGLGKLESDEAEKIADHLDLCHDCSETISNLQDDTFVSLVRNVPVPDNGFDHEPQVGNAQQLAADVTVDSTSGANEDARDSTELPSELRDHPRYEVLELIGRGGMGDVYKAQHKVMSRVVALKVIKPELVRNEAAVARFQREVQAAARLHHGKIVTAYDAEQAGDLHYLVMEFVDGVNLDEVIRDRGALPVAEACSSWEYVVM